MNVQQAEKLTTTQQIQKDNPPLINELWHYELQEELQNLESKMDEYVSH
jgi:hypothetical protein